MRKIVSFFLFVLLVSTLLPLGLPNEAFALTGGLLDGKTITIKNGTTKALTDDNSSTYVSFNPNYVSYLQYVFSAPVDLASFQMNFSKSNSSSPNPVVHAYDSSGAEIKSSGAAAGAKTAFVVSGVKRIYVSFSASWNVYYYINEFDVFAQEVPPPSQPTGLTANPGDKKVVLNWNPNPEPEVNNYQIYKDGNYLTTVASPATSYTATGLNNGTTYGFTIVAVNTAGKVSTDSEPVYAMPEPVVPPDKPTGLTAQAGYSQVSLTWNPNPEPNLKEYQVYANGNYIGTVASPETTYTAKGLINRTKYGFYIVALNTLGTRSANSDTVYATPQLIVTTSPGNGNVQVSWPPVPDATDYVIYRDGVVIGHSSTGTFEDTTAQNGTIYDYQVAPVVGGVEQEPSSGATAQPGNFISFSGGFEASVVDSLKTGLNFILKINKWVLLVAAIILTPFLIRTIEWLIYLARRKQKPKEEPSTPKKRESRKLTPEEREERAKERRQNKARDDKYEHLTRLGRISERDKWAQSVNYLNPSQRKEKAREERNRKAREARAAARATKGGREQRQIRRRRRGR